MPKKLNKKGSVASSKIHVYFIFKKTKLLSFNAQNWWTDYLLTIFP